MILAGWKQSGRVRRSGPIRCGSTWKGALSPDSGSWFFDQLRYAPAGGADECKIEFDLLTESLIGSDSAMPWIGLGWLGIQK